jgi:hypothetical protein
MGIKQMAAFDGRFDRVREELNKVLGSSYSGYLSEAMRIGNAATFALRVLDGSYEVTEASYKVTTPLEDQDAR